jgi:hypothetical protein
MNRVVWTQINKTCNGREQSVICVGLFYLSVDSIRGNEAKHKSYGFASSMSSMASKSALREMQSLMYSLCATRPDRVYFTRRGANRMNFKGLLQSHPTAIASSH